MCDRKSGIADITETTTYAEGDNESSIILSKQEPDLANSLSQEDVQAFIEEVKGRPALWNYTKSQKNSSLRESNWRELRDKFGTKQHVLKMQWKNLRESFSRCLEKRDLKSKCAESPWRGKEPTCRYYNELSFLRDVIVKTSTLANMHLVPSQLHNFTIESDDSISTPIAIQPAVTVTTQDYSNTIQKRKVVDNDKTLMHVQCKDDKTVLFMQCNEEEDSDMLFCKSIANTLRELPRRKNALVRMRIQELLFNAQFDENFDYFE